MALTNNILLSITSILTKSEGLLNLEANVAEKITNQLTAVSCDLLYSNTLTLSSGAQIDLAGGSLTDPFGNALTFDKVMFVLLKNNGSNAMKYGGANNVPLLDGSTDKKNLGPSAIDVMIDENGIAVTAGTGDLITITGTDGDTVDILIIGSSPP